MRIEICVGSSCHLKGAQQVVLAFQEEIAKHLMTENAQLELVGSFCQGNCTKGVNIKIDGQIFSSVTPEKVSELFDKWVLGGLTHASDIYPQSGL